MTAAEEIGEGKQSMETKQSSFAEIAESEHDLVLRGAERYGAYYSNALAFVTLLQTFLKSVDAQGFVFVMFLSLVRKHTTLALLSALRLHHVQAAMNLRQALEAGACAAYAIANPRVEDFADVNETGVLDASQELAKKRYGWLDQHYPRASSAMKNMKALINRSTAHASIVYAHQNFVFAPERGQFETPFFDIEDELVVRTDLWHIANITMALVDTFYGVNRDRTVMQFVGDYLPRLKTLEEDNKRLRDEMLSHPRLARWADVEKRI